MVRPMSNEHVVVAALLRCGGRILMTHRSPRRLWYPDTWDLPGGHVAEGEKPRHALVRELDEELGIAATVSGSPFARVRGTDFRMDVWVIDHWSGEPSNREPREHDALAWLSDEELDGLRLADHRLLHLAHTALRPAQ